MRLTRIVAAAAAVPLALLPTTPAAAAPPSPATYLALGDSLPAGVGAPADWATSPCSRRRSATVAAAKARPWAAGSSWTTGR